MSKNISSSNNFCFSILFTFIQKIDYPLFNNVFKVISSDQYAYAIVQNQNEYFIVQYQVDQNQIHYMNSINSFNLNFNVINDISIDDNFIYIATDNGLLKADYLTNENNLIFFRLEFLRNS